MNLQAKMLLTILDIVWTSTFCINFMSIFFSSLTRGFKIRKRIKINIVFRLSLTNIPECLGQMTKNPHPITGTKSVFKTKKEE